MGETNRTEAAKNKPIDSHSVNPELPSPITNIRVQDRGQFLDTISNRLYTILKIVGFSLLLTTILIFKEIYTPQGIVIMPFEISKNENLSGIAIADQLTYELSRIQQIHNFNNDEVVLNTGSVHYTTTFSAEQSLGGHEMVVPKSEIIEFSMADTGTIDIGSNSLSMGKLIIAFKTVMILRQGSCPKDEKPGES